MPYLTVASGDLLTAAQWNTNVRDQTIASCTFATRPTSPVSGQYIYETDTLNTYYWNNTAWTLVPPTASPTFTGTPAAPTATTGTNTTQLATTAFANAAGGLVYITSVAATGASTTISNCFSSTYENYRVIFSNGATTNTAVYFYLQWTIAGVASVTNMAWSYTGLNENGTTYSDYAGNGAVNSLAKLLPNPGFAGAVNNLSMDVYMPFLTARTFATFQGTTYPSGFTFTSGGIAQDQQTSKDGFKLGISSGTYTGNITVYGYRKA